MRLEFELLLLCYKHDNGAIAIAFACLFDLNRRKPFYVN